MSDDNSKPWESTPLPEEWNEAVDNMAKAIQEEIDHEILLEILIESDDGIRPLTDEEVSYRFQRVSGDAICHICNQPYRKHPHETRVIGYNGEPFLRKLCNGWLGKL